MFGAEEVPPVRVGPGLEGTLVVMTSPSSWRCGPLDAWAAHSTSPAPPSSSASGSTPAGATAVDADLDFRLAVDTNG